MKFAFDFLNKISGSSASFEGRNKIFWENFAVESRRDLVPPSAPSSDTLSIFKKILEDISPRNILVLGATFGIRIMLAELGINHYIVADNSRKMIEKFPEIKKIEPSRETRIIGDWMDLGKKVHSIDLVIGDFVLNQISPKNQKKFLKLLYEILNPNGFFITRCHSAEVHFETVDPEKIILDVLNMDCAYSAADLATILSYRLRDKFRNKHTDLSDPQLIYDALINIKTNDRKGKIILKILLNEYKKRIKYNLPHVTQTSEKLSSLLATAFEIKNTLFAKDIEGSINFPIYFLQKKYYL